MSQLDAMSEKDRQEMASWRAPDTSAGQRSITPDQQAMIDLAKASNPKDVDWNNPKIWALAESHDSPLRRLFLEGQIAFFEELQANADNPDHDIRFKGRTTKVGTHERDQRSIETNLGNLRAELSRLNKPQ